MAKVGYARLSGLEQCRDSSALEQQQQRLRDAGCTTLYTDIQSGTKDNRPELKAALAALQPTDTLIATRLDRLTRSPRFNEQLLNRFSADGAPGLVLLDDGLDLKTVAGRLTARLLAAVAAGEVERLSERVAHGKAHRQSKGGHGAVPPWGFLRAPDGLGLVVDPNLQPITKGAIDYFLQSRSIRATGTWLLETHNVKKGKTSLHRWFRNPALAGGIGRCRGINVTKADGSVQYMPPRAGAYHAIEWGQHQGLVSEGEWAEVARALLINAERTSGSHRVTAIRRWWSGRFHCQGCNRFMRAHHRLIRCDSPDCSHRYGHGSIAVTLARASLVRAIEWMGAELAYQLAPLKAAAESSAPVEPTELLELRQQVHQLKAMAIPGTEAVITEKESAIAAMQQQLHGTAVSTVAVLERLLPLLRRPWSLSDDELQQLSDDAELVATPVDHWIVSVESKRFGCSWQFNPATRREVFRIDTAATAATPTRMGLDDAAALNRTAAWWAAVDDEAERQGQA